MIKISNKIAIGISAIILISCGGISGIRIPENYQKALPPKVSIDMINIPQNDNYSCAHTSLAMVMSYYDNKEYDKNEVWDRSGSSVYQVTKECGHDVNGLKKRQSPLIFPNMNLFPT